MANSGGVPAAAGGASRRTSSTMRDNIIKVLTRSTSAFTGTTICEQGRPTEFYQRNGTGARDGTRIGNAEPGRGRGAGVVRDDHEARGNTWIRDSALVRSSMRYSLGRTATEITRGRESVTPVAVGRAGRSRGGADTCRGAGVHVGGRGSRAGVGEAGVVYETGRMLVDAVGRVLRTRPGGGDG